MLNKLKKQLHQIPVSGIRAFNEEAAAVPDCISLTLGEPAFDTPKDIKKALKQALDHNHTHYAAAMGDLDLRRKIAVYEWKIIISYMMLMKSWYARVQVMRFLPLWPH